MEATTTTLRQRRRDGDNEAWSDLGGGFEADGGAAVESKIVEPRRHRRWLVAIKMMQVAAEMTEMVVVGKDDAKGW